MSGTTRVSRYQKGKTRQVKTNLNLLEQEIVNGSGICWAICKVCTSSQTTRPTSHQSVFLQARCPSCRPTNSVKTLKAKDTLSITGTFSDKSTTCELVVVPDTFRHHLNTHYFQQAFQPTYGLICSSDSPDHCAQFKLYPLTYLLT